MRFSRFGQDEKGGAPRLDYSIIDALLDHPKVGMILSTRKDRNLQFECQLEAGTFPLLEVMTQPLPTLVNTLGLNNRCQVFCEQGRSVLIAEARIVDYVSETRLRIQILSTRKENQKRQFFRVDTVVCLQHWLSGVSDGGDEKMSLQRVNLSGNGIRFKTDQRMQEGQKVNLRLAIPQYSVDPIQATGEVVRVFSGQSPKQDVAVKLSGLQASAQDKLLSFCVQEQARQMQLAAS